MKKGYIAIISLLLVLVLAGCSALPSVVIAPGIAGIDDQQQATPQETLSLSAGGNDVQESLPAADNDVPESLPQQTDPAPTVESNPQKKEKITAAQAKAAAFKHANVKESNVTDLEVELDKDDGALHYDVSFDAGTYDYEYEIDAYSGKILKNKKEKDDDRPVSAPPVPTEETQPKASTSPAKKTKAEAKKIAFNHANVKDADVYDLEVELDKDDGKARYEISFQSGGYDYEYEIHAETGKILHQEKERDD